MDRAAVDLVAVVGAVDVVEDAADGDNVGESSIEGWTGV